MKKLILIILLMSFKLYPQSWGDQIELTAIIEANLVTMDMYTNNNAIYLAVVDIYDDIRVYKVSSSGNVYSGFPKTISTDGKFPSISGSNDGLYITYLSEDSIKTKYSSDNGENWTQLEFARYTTGNECNGIDNRYQPGYGLHITWATKDWQGLTRPITLVIM